MSATIETIVACDICGGNNNADDRCDTATQIRKSRSDMGWVHRGRFDFCPDCKEEGFKRMKAARAILRAFGPISKRHNNTISK